MNILRENQRVRAEKWSRYRYNLTTNIGKDGTRLTGCAEHIELCAKRILKMLLKLD